MQILTRNWWVPTLRGAVAILFGILVIAWPGSALAAFVLLFGAFAIVDGVLSLIGAFRPVRDRSRWLLVGFGLVSLGAGAVVLAYPGLSAVALVYLVAVWAILVGFFAMTGAVALRKVISGEWLLGVFGALSAALGFFLIGWPMEGALGLLWAVGVYAIVAGFMLVVLGIRLRAWNRAEEERAAAAPRRRSPLAQPPRRRSGRSRRRTR